MLKISLRSVLSHKLRLALTAIAVVLGVAFASGMLMLTSALDRTFVDIFESNAQDVLVTLEPAVEADITQDVGDQAPLLLDESLVAQVSEVEGVAVAEGGINANGAYLIDADGEVVGAVGPPAIGVEWTESVDLRPATLVAGSEPAAEFDVAVDEVTFPKLGLEIGDPLAVLTPVGQVDTTLVGTFRFGESGGLAGATVTAFVPETAQRLFAEPGKWTSIAVGTEEGFTDDQVATSIEALLGGEYLVQTRDEQVEASADALREGLGFLSAILLGFAGIALFVAAFLIYNTFSMLVAARGREMALLRAVGATRRQVLGSVLLEAVLLGLIAAGVGVGVGYGLALLLKAGVGALGLDLTAGITPTANAIVLALATGLTVTVVSAVAPALRASRIRPLEALRQAGTSADRPSLVMSLLGLLALIVAAVLFGPSLVVDEPSAGRTAIGALVLLLAGILLAPVLASGFAKLMTAPMGLIGGVSGRIAGRNAARSPRRVAATASALIVGLALVSGVTVIVASAQKSIEDLVDSAFGAELVVSTPTGQPFATAIGDDIEQIDGVEYVVRQSLGPAEIDGDTTSVTAIGGGPISAVFTITTLEGDLDDLGPGTAVVDDDFVEDRGVGLGDSATLLFPSGEERSLEIVAIYEPNVLLEGLVLDLDDYREVGGAAQDTVLFVTLAEGADSAAVVADVEDVAAANPLLQVSDQTAIKEQNSATLDQLLYIIYAMLGLSIIIAALGVVNTMVLSVLERTRELGMLRAVGAGRRQVRRMVRWEAVLVSMLGALAGIGIGVLAGVGLQRSLAATGIDQLVIPPGTFTVLIVAGLVIGVLGAAFPARRATKLNILDSIATE
jgi:putative ABC transport system permease protein